MTNGAGGNNQDAIRSGIDEIIAELREVTDMMTDLRNHDFRGRPRFKCSPIINRPEPTCHRTYYSLGASLEAIALLLGDVPDMVRQVRGLINADDGPET